MLTKILLCLMMICLTQINAFIHTPKPTERQLSYLKKHKKQGAIYGINAIGYEYNVGLMWAVLCNDTEHGSVPGKKVKKSWNGLYTWGGEEYPCNDYDLINGMLVHQKTPLPEGCQPKGFQPNDNGAYFNAVVDSEYGMIPGKANADRSMAWFGHDGHEHWVRDNFYVIC